MTNIGRYVLTAVLIAILTGCSVSSINRNAETVVPEVLKFGPMAPNPFGNNVTLSQTITGTFGEKERSLRFEVELRSDRLVMLALTHIGVPVFSIEYDGKDAQIQHFVSAADQIDPYWILNDFLLVYWPEIELSKALVSTGYKLEVGQKERAMLDGSGHIAVMVTYLTPHMLGSDVNLDNYQLHYSLKVRTHKISQEAAK